MKKHLALKFVGMVTLVMVIATVLSGLSPTEKFNLVRMILFIGSLATAVILYITWSARNQPRPFVSPAPEPIVREYRWGIPFDGPQNGPPCNMCGTATIVASSGLCASLYWCVKCNKNAMPGVHAPSS